MTFPALVAAELASARDIYLPHNSAHESYAVILEELQEYWEECRKKPRYRCKARMLEELVQTAAMCQRAAEDLGLVE